AAVPVPASSPLPCPGGGLDAHSTPPARLHPTLCSRWFEPVRRRNFQGFAAKRYSCDQIKALWNSVNTQPTPTASRRALFVSGKSSVVKNGAAPLTKGT